MSRHSPMKGTPSSPARSASRKKVSPRRASPLPRSTPHSISLRAKEEDAGCRTCDGWGKFSAQLHFEFAPWQSEFRFEGPTPNDRPPGWQSELIFAPDQLELSFPSSGGLPASASAPALRSGNKGSHR